MIPHVLGTLTLLAVALLFGATWYEAVVMAPNYERDVPDSLSLARQFLQRTTPAHYFRVVAPIAQILALLSAIFAWKSAARWPFVVAFVLLVLGDVITFAFHYPRLAIMFKSDAAQVPGRLARAAREWAIGNWVRGVLLALVVLALLHGLLRLAV